MNEHPEIILQKDWDQHPWLSQLNCASDLDGNAAFFLPDTHVDALSALQAVQLEYNYDGAFWEPVTRTVGGIFPSHGWAQAAATWYWPLLDHPLLTLDPTHDLEIQWRAIVPSGGTFA